MHPNLAPEQSAFSIFHQLHYLVSKSIQRCAVCGSRSHITRWDELQHVIYVLYNQVFTYADIANEKRALLKQSLDHIHCYINLLRQSLMCNADLTVELKDVQLSRVTSFGTQHECTH